MFSALISDDPAYTWTGGVIASAIGAVAIYHIAREVWQRWKADKRAAKLETDAKDSQLLAALQDVVSGLDTLTGKLPGLFDVVSVGNELKGLSEGMEKMCKAMAERTDTLNKAVEILQASISPAGGRLEDYSAFADDTPEARRAAEQIEIAELMRRGNVSEEGAAARVRERNIYSQLGR
jgi:hypothetical protein